VTCDQFSFFAVSTAHTLHYLRFRAVTNRCPNTVEFALIRPDPAPLFPLHLLRLPVRNLRRPRTRETPAATLLEKKTSGCLPIQVSATRPNLLGKALHSWDCLISPLRKAGASTCRDNRSAAKRARDAAGQAKEQLLFHTLYNLLFWWCELSEGSASQKGFARV
jgi:hypothetical protein